ncbi:hypothetical protein NIES2107_12790 [Nostoc carneum NIES-2107]|nr:hypothetical protein NIES2107_12790 [Nostoc carneum NIES-2107]
MQNQSKEITPKSMNEIESLNDIVELDIASLEAIAGGGCGIKGRDCGINNITVPTGSKQESDTISLSTIALSGN